MTIICLAKAVDTLFTRFYSCAFHAIIGIVIAATIMTIPFSGFRDGRSILINLICVAVGIGAALLLDRFNSRFQVDKAT